MDLTQGIMIDPKLRKMQEKLTLALTNFQAIALRDPNPAEASMIALAVGYALSEPVPNSGVDLRRVFIALELAELNTRVGSRT